MPPIVIIGTGLAGYTLAREFRKLDRDTPLVLISADDGAFYTKPALSNALAAGKTPQRLVDTPAEAMAARLDATIRTCTRVTALEPDAHRLHLEDGETLDYDRLVIAWGADPIRLPIEGDAADSVLSVNDLADYARFRTAIAHDRRVLILGAGLIGSEFANDLAGAGFEVDVVDPAPWPLGRLLPAAAGEAMAAGLKAVGVRLHPGRSVTRLDRTPDGIAATLDDGSTIPTGTVLSAVGLRPRTALAAAAELAVNRGIVVDAHLQCSVADIHALGDCAEIDGQVRPFVMPILHAARALARTLAGEPTAVAFPPMPVIVKTPACPAVVAPPPPGAEGEWEVAHEAGGLVCRFRDRDGALRGFALTGGATERRNALTAELS
ncbi:MAG: FAD-dependent oxidoreductase [Ectothiorhodospiraceae bacterium]|jgi:rubredoxin-NAD+ reductase|nr:FAD-dependent oxidoreductase [Ectothiorhodospiraceae bacterium]